LTDLFTVLSQCTRVTDRQIDRQTDRQTDGRTFGQTDRILIARPRLHTMQRGKNAKGSYRPMPTFTETDIVS